VAPAAATTTTRRKAAPTTRAPAPTTTAAALGQVHVSLTRVASLQQPLALAVRPGDPMLYVAEKGGRVRALDGHVVLDISADVTTGSEQGLLGLAFAPDGAAMYIDYTDRPGGHTHVVEYTWRNGVADPASRRELLFQTQPYANHNGGEVIFGPDHYLYIGFGDGGSAGDPQNNAQRLDTWLGKLLRIDPHPSGTSAYTVPPNPFAGRLGARPEIWDFGLRNPWRFSFDRATGDLWIGDVGQNAWEEVDHEQAGRGGRNYGWARLEGSHPYNGSPPAGAVGPVIEYGHGHGECAVTGGYVYRGNRIPGLAGAYLYADFCLGRVQAALVSSDRVVASRDLGVQADQLSSFGEDAAGELYALSLAGGVYRIDPA
jgi:glucose/arabinose dehydrogenase